MDLKEACEAGRPYEVESTFHSGESCPKSVNILHSAILTLRSRNPHGTALFCIVPRNEIFSSRASGILIFPASAYSVYSVVASSFPDPDLNSQHDVPQNLNFPLAITCSDQLRPSISPTSDSCSFVSIRGSSSPAFVDFPLQLPAFRIFTFVSPCIHDFHAKKISRSILPSIFSFSSMEIPPSVNKSTQVPATANSDHLSTPLTTTHAAIPTTLLTSRLGTFLFPMSPCRHVASPQNVDFYFTSTCNNSF